MNDTASPQRAPSESTARSETAWLQKTDTSDSCWSSTSSKNSSTTQQRSTLPSLTLTFPDGGPVVEFMLHIHDDGTASWRWHDEPFDAVNP
ncbi:hypothetical protein [Streptomyces albipurpureus]|uniref:Uncharacterized protein n=1 Tax=Streptomyces albipurpureus TaxID=2897419 RepID=A0ABT0UGX5_9ACTN|nr:hypothetical protein [Streptomyces sp. CWNU-1]MCM2387426.1 hypothetical protein [Streptomyces sp. CWNU-1]